MITTHNSIKIHQPIEAVWQYLMNLDNYPLWQAGVLNVTASNGAEVGSKLIVDTFALGRHLNLNATVTENDKHNRYSVQSIQGPLTFTSTYFLKSAEDGTEVEFICEIDTHTVFDLAKPILEAITYNKNEADLSSLKILLEGAALPTKELGSEAD